MAVHLDPEKKINRKVSHLNGVKGKVKDQAGDIARRAEANLAAVRDTKNKTNHDVNVTQGVVDSFVNLEGMAPHAVEFGHFYDGNIGGEPRWIEGKFILSKAAGFRS